MEKKRQMNNSRIAAHGLRPADLELSNKSRRLFQTALVALAQKNLALAAIIESVGQPTVLDIDRPVYAGAFFDHDWQSSYLLLNAPRFNSIQPLERVAVLAHEAIHFYRQDEQLLCSHEGFDLFFALATDICINDSLRKAGFQLPPGSPTGERMIGWDCAQSDPEDLLELLLARSGYIPLETDQLLADLQGMEKSSALSIPRARVVRTSS